MIDLHCHILPGIDDGPATVEGSIALARAAVDAGTAAIVATPHVSRGYLSNTAASIAVAVDELRTTLAEHQIPLELHTGAELSMPRAVELGDVELRALRLGGPDATHLLVECPLQHDARGLEDGLDQLRARGHQILLAHPERCPAFQREPQAYERLIAKGMLGQVTAGALVGRFGRLVEELGNRLVREGLAQVAASDAHSEIRPPSIGAELIEAGHGDRADWLARAVPQSVLAGTALPVAPASG